MSYLVKTLTSWIVVSSLLEAVPIELFKSKHPSRFDNYGVTMWAKIRSVDCTHMIGYGKRERQSCRVTADYRTKGKPDQMIILIFDKRQEMTLNALKNRDYRFISCVYGHKKRRMDECVVK